MSLKTTSYGVEELEELFKNIKEIWRFTATEPELIDTASTIEN